MKSSAVNQKERLILNFHGLGPIPNWVELADRDYWCEKDRFSAILTSIDALSRNLPIDITFDDGNISDAVIALPTLVDRGLTASFFICAGRIGLSRYLDNSAMKDIISCGMEVGSHGWGHVNWRRVDDKTLDVEIDDARKKIADVVGRAVDKVSIPFGSYDRRVVDRLRRSDIKTVFTSDGGRAPFSGWMLPRETFRRISWDDKALVEIAARPFYMKTIYRSAKRFLKRLR